MLQQEGEGPQGCGCAHMSVEVYAWERRVMPAPRFCQLPSMLLARASSPPAMSLPGPHFLSLQSSSSIIVHLAPPTRREARLLQAEVSPAPLDASCASCAVNKQNILCRKKHQVTPWLRLWPDYFCKVVCDWSLSSKLTHARAPQPHSPKEGWEHLCVLLWHISTCCEQCNAHKCLGGNKALPAGDTLPKITESQTQPE